MNTVVGRLLDVDREAGAILAEGEQYRERTREDLRAEKDKLLALFTERTERHLKELAAEQTAEAREHLADLERRTLDILTAMQSRYNALHLGWEEELARRCMGD